MQADLGERVTRMEERVDSELRHMASKEDLGDLRTGMADLRGEMLAMETRLMRWMAMIVAAGVGVTAAIVTLA